MAEQIPYGVAEGLISKLVSLAFLEIGRVYGVMDKLEKLKQTLEDIKVVLSDAEERQSVDRDIEHWIRRFKQILHDADDLLDDLAIRDSRRKVDVDGGSSSASKVHRFFSSENSLVFRAKLAWKIEEIQKNFNCVAENMSKLKLNSSFVVLNQHESNGRETSSFVLESEIIGREDNKNDIMNLLNQTHTNEDVSLIAIVGMGGLGKTALAQLVYNAAQAQNLFQKHMWVCISEDFEVKSVLKKILKSLEKDEIGDLELDILQHKVRKELNGQKYMLVLDDVWSESQLKWNDLRTYLACGGRGSKILVTTRSKNVAQVMGINTPYVLEDLKEEQSWTLLKKVVFGEDVSRMSRDLGLIGEEIAKKCRGVPLAIRTMGGLLRSVTEESEWMKILDGDFWRVCREKESIMPVLKLSYQKLPLELRQCFAYCYLFPKDWEISKDELIQLWMAQGYLENSIESQSLEDVGTQYVKTLLMRSFFQEASMTEYGDIKSFKIHDLMHDLAKSIVGNDCYLESEGKGIVGRPMHVTLETNTSSSWDSLDAGHLRTIICWEMEAELPINASFFRSLKSLRVLNVSNSSITQLPKFVDKIKHLKYLDLSYCYELASLPESIGNLVGLQTLKLRKCKKLVFSVEVITKLINLRYLDISGCKCFEERMPPGLRKLTSLQYLSDFVVADSRRSKSGKLNELKELNNIRRELTISNLRLVKEVESESQETNLKAKKYLQSLKLLWGRYLYSGDEIENEVSDNLQLLNNLNPPQNLKKLTVSGYPGTGFSNWVSSLTKIVNIDFFGLPKCQHLPPLEKLPCLKTLEIRDMKELKCIYCEEVSPVFFPSLETLQLSKCWNLKGWQRLGDNDNNLSLPPFPRLSSLEIVNCPNMTCMPSFPRLFENLELFRSSAKPLMETCLVQLEPSSSLLHPLSALRHLEIGGVTEVEAMPDEWMQNLTSLGHLSLQGSSIVRTMSRHLQHLPSQLQELDIEEVDKLDLWKDEEEDDNTLYQAPFHCLRSLQRIRFCFCDNMKALPEQIGNLQSLKHIEIHYCPQLESLPEAICCLTNLHTLEIIECPLLNDRCKAETGQDWPKIAHIPNICIDYEKVNIGSETLS